MNKRGISTLIATVLLVLITIAAVGIIWGAILPMVQKILGQQKACGLETRLNIDKSQGWTCFNSKEKAVLVMIEKPTNFDLTGIIVQISGEGKKIVKKIKPIESNEVCGPFSDICMWNTTHWIKRIQLPKEVGEALTYKIFVNFNATQVAVAPIVKLGVTEYECSNLVTEDLEEC